MPSNYNMPSNYKLSFGNYVFPATLRPDGGSVDVDLGESELPRQDGSVTQVGRTKSRTLKITGDIQGDTPGELWTGLDLLRGCCARGTAGKLYFGRDDRFYNAQVESYSEAYTDGLLWGSVATLSIGFKAASPFALANAPDTVNFPAGGSPSGSTPVETWIIDPDGDANVRVLPAWSITIGAAGTGPLTLSNAATLEACTLSGPFAAGDVIVLTRDGYTVTQNGLPNFALLSGRIPMIVPDPNTISLTAGGTSTVSAFSATYTPRWA